MPDSVPNYLSVDANGNVGANFSGKIHAQGLNLDTASSRITQDVDSIRWINTGNGYVPVSIQAWEDALNDQLVVDVEAQTADRTADIFLVAGNPSGVGGAGAGADLHISSGSNLFPTASLLAEAGAFQARILNSNGGSDFVQFSNIQNFAANGPTPIGWTVNVKSPTVVLIVGGSGFNTTTGRPNGNPIFFNGSQVSGFDFSWNVANQHLWMGNRIIVVTNQTPGNKVFSINSSGSTQTNNADDYFHLLVLN